MNIFDRRTQHHKAEYVLFWRLWFGVETVELYSSKRSAVRELKEYPQIYQVVHDSAGKLVAYSKCGKAVIL